MFSFSNIADYHRQLHSRTTSCTEAVLHYSQRIREQVSLNALLYHYEEEALQRARELDARREQGQPMGKLHGVVVTLKDVISYRHHPLGAASRILDGFTAQYHATAVERLLAEEAIIIGSNNCDEFAMGSSNENSAYGPVRNAAHPNRVPGGSSGGSAVAVQ
ncbi:MAG TPA: amidase, partial [Lacibacter sp.]|nr:amidase [Lacibacter sp.]